MNEKEELDFLELDLFIEQRIVDMGLTSKILEVRTLGELSDFSTIKSIHICTKGSYVDSPNYIVNIMTLYRLPDKYVIRTYTPNSNHKIDECEYSITSMDSYLSTMNNVLGSFKQNVNIYMEVFDELIEYFMAIL